MASHLLWKAVLSHLFLWPTVCKWHYTLCQMQPHHMTNRKWVTLHILCKVILSHDQQFVSLDMAHFVKGTLITSCPMTNRKCVTLHILWKAVTSHHFLWPIVCEWYCTFCERQSHHIISYNWQFVSDVAHFVKGSLNTFYDYDQQQVSGIAHFVNSSLITSFPMTNSEWVTLHILWKTVSSHLFLWPTGSEWHCTLGEI